MGVYDPLKKLLANDVNSEFRQEDREKIAGMIATHKRMRKILESAMAFGVISSSGTTANGIFLGFQSAGLTGFSDMLLAVMLSIVAAVLIGVGTIQLMRLAGDSDA